MLPLEDRLRVALGNSLGVALQPKDVAAVCGLIVFVRQVQNNPQMPAETRRLATAAMRRVEG